MMGFLVEAKAWGMATHLWEEIGPMIASLPNSWSGWKTTKKRFARKKVPKWNLKDSRCISSNFSHVLFFTIFVKISPKGGSGEFRSFNSRNFNHQRSNHQHNPWQVYFSVSLSMNPKRLQLLGGFLGLRWSKNPQNGSPIVTRACPLRNHNNGITAWKEWNIDKPHFL